jgi:hypothetical protein
MFHGKFALLVFAHSNQCRMRGLSFMNPVFFLLATSALGGVLLGLNYFGLGAVLISTLIVSVLAAVILQNAGFGFFPGIAIIVGCQTVHQLGFALGSILVNRNRD